MLNDYLEIYSVDFVTMHHIILVSIFIIWIKYFSLADNDLIWNKNVRNFIPINFTQYDIPVKKKARDVLVERSKLFENHKFQGELIKFAYYQENHLVDFHDHNTEVSGVCGEIWNSLAEYLNFTLLPMKIDEDTLGTNLDNGTYTGLLGLIQRREVHVLPRVNFYRVHMKLMDYTTPLWKNYFQLYNRPEYKSNDSWLFKLFSFETWIIVMIITVVISILGTVEGRISCRLDHQKHYWTFQDYFFYTFSTVCSQGWVPKNLEEESKILELSKRIFSWFLLITMGSHLVSYMTNKKMDAPFYDLRSLLNSTEYNVLAHNGSLAYGFIQMEIARNKKYHNRFQYSESIIKMRDKVCWNKKKYAMVLLNDKQQASVGGCNIVKTGSPLFGTWTTSGIVKGFKYKRAFDIGIIKLYETGLLDGMRDRWLQTRTPDQQSDQITESINIYHVYMLFVFLLVGTVLSAIICIFERTTYSSRLHHIQQRKLIKFQRQLQSNNFLVTRRKFRPMRKF